MTKKKVKWLIKKKEEGESSSVIARALKVTVKRVNQVWTECKSTGAIPEIGKNAGRPPGGPLSEDEKEIILKTRQRYRLGARRLEPLIERDYRVHIPHNRIHGFLLKEGLAQPNARKQKRRRWVRYEREHSMSAGHIDWHDSEDGRAVCAIEDDCSRRILACGEFGSQNSDNSMLVFREVVDRFWSIYPMRELILDHGSAF